jgi:hypothetical protein
MIKARNLTQVFKRKNFKPRQLESSYVKNSSSIENLSINRKGLSKNNISPYASKSSLSFTQIEGVHKANKHRSLKMITKMIPDIEKIGVSKKRIKESTFLSDSRVQKSSTKDSYSSKVKDLVRAFKESANLPNKREINDRIFSEVIAYNKEFEPILTLLRKYFNSLIKNQQADLEHYVIKYEDLKKHREELLIDNNNLEILSKEMKDQLEELKKKLTNISDKFIKISNIEFSVKDFNECNFKKLLQANNMYEEALANLREKVRYYKHKAKKMVRLLTVLENKGFPVQDIYIKEVNKKKILPKYEGNSEFEDDTENENIVSAKVETFEVPSFVPKLDIAMVPQPSFSSDDEDSSKSEESTF